MTDQQKKAVEESVGKYIPNSHWQLEFPKALYEEGLVEVINNPEKYGLIEISKVLQGLGLKGGDTCNP